MAIVIWSVTFDKCMQVSNDRAKEGLDLGYISPVCSLTTALEAASNGTLSSELLPTKIENLTRESAELG